LRLGTIEPGAGPGERPPAAQPQGQAQEFRALTAGTRSEPATAEATPERPVAGAASDEDQSAAALAGASMPATGEAAPAREAPAEAPAAAAAGGPEGAAGTATPEARVTSLMADSIRRALAAVLGGPPPVSERPPRERAQQPTESAPSLAEQERARPETAAPAVGPVGSVRPSFDIVRVERDGRAVLAGRAAPGAEVELRSGERLLDRVTASRRGEWVSTPAEPLAPGGHELTVAARGSAGAPLLTAEQVLVVALPEPPPPQPAATALAGPPPPQPAELAKGGPPPPQPAEVALAGADPVAVLLSREKGGAGRILQAPGRISGDGKLALLVLDYDDGGQIRLSGEAPPGAPVRIYVDNQPSAEVTVEPSGKWTTLLDRELAPGDYTLRLDQLGSDGAPVARLETPFTRVRQPPVAGQAQVDYVIVQPGNSLWRIARRLFGQGFKYVHLYDANQAQIRDPDLIYPGQVFEVPAALGTAG
jgi:nucleoid-associated protein YgaU